jgi:GntR family transcriptional regulator
MDITILATSPEPVYEQIVRQVQDGVASGDLPPGAPLPTVRQLAGDLQLNRNTVARAYKQLEDRGVILTAGRRGTFVREQASREVERIKSDRAERKVEQVVSALLGEGVTREEIAALFKDALRVSRDRTKETVS